MNDMVKAKPFANLQNKLMKHSPEILVTVGVIGMVGSTVLACKATLKAKPVLDEHKKNMDLIKTATEDGRVASEQDGIVSIAEYTAKDRRDDVIKATTQTAIALAKVYAVPATMMIASAYAIYSGHGITVKRNVGLSSALTLVSSGYKEYRNRVRDKYGDDVEQDIYYGREEVEEEVDTGNGKTKKVKKYSEIVLPNGPSPYAKYFDEYCPGWQNSPELNLVYLRVKQQHANDLLRINKVLFLNQVYEMIGLPQTREGQVVGWAWNEGGDNWVDFGIYDGTEPQRRRFVNGDEASILLDFNVDGPVLDYL